VTFLSHGYLFNYKFVILYNYNFCLNFVVVIETAFLFRTVLPLLCEPEA
jgi:hypothetical protein